MSITTPLDPLHRALGARMVDFAGYALPLHYRPGIMAEHLACRAGAALFDVSHMGQARLEGPDAASFLETLIPADLVGLAVGRQRYGVLTNEAGGIEDDLMIARTGPDTFFLIVNAARKAQDFASIRAALPQSLRLTELPDRALLALQGPRAVQCLSSLSLPDLAGLRFLDVIETRIAGIACLAARSGYTGEDGFEISCAARDAIALGEHILAQPGVILAGLGARDTLRLEAGLCLYGADLDPQTNPIEAGLGFAIGRRRRAEGGFVGAGPILHALASGPARRRIGLRPDGRAPVRAGADILGPDGAVVGQVTSGSFSPSLDAPIAMGYVRVPFADPAIGLGLMVRGRAIAARTVALPFIPHRYAV